MLSTEYSRWKALGDFCGPAILRVFVKVPVVRAMLSLVWRSTFIDFEDEEPRRARRPRAGSEPRRRLPGSEIFDGERSYVAGLRERYARCPATTSSCFPEPQVQKSNGAVSSMLLRAKVEGEAEGAPATVGDAETREPSSAASSVAVGAPPPAGGHAEPAEEKPSSCNRGSVGHPVLCSRPCLYFATGECANGVDCEFCHMTHSKRMPHLNKAHREQLRNMEALKAKTLLIPLVRDKALAFDGSAQTALAVDRLARACGVPRTPYMRRTREEQSLNNMLNGMTLRLLLIIFQRSVLQNEPEAQDAAEALLTHLRNTVTGTGAHR
mmetsp:Transcript_81844/g.236573  ORF Transcript_81844/g.236573 Transcript_81844/m.236573 type:complete len:324 (-) Transcript_81844:374-1345(-)